jgi:aminodeoxyfutalosine deaminase
VKLVTGQWVIPVEGPPVEGGALLVSEGKILALGKKADLATAWPALPLEEHEGCALVPALVNAHCHLELTELGGLGPAGDFIDWLLDTVLRKREAASETFAQGLLAGARFCRSAGQAVVADVLSAAAFPLAAYPSDGARIAVFPEVIAPRDEHAEPALRRALEVTLSGSAYRAGLSPHSPYTAGDLAYRRCAENAFPSGRLLMTHLAESPQEVLFCRTGGGPMAEQLYARFDVPPPDAAGLHPLEWMENLGLVGPQTLFVHSVQLEKAHIELLARRRGRVILCPRSNGHVGAGTAPGRALLDAGVNVGLGTDSRLSAGDLNLWSDILRAIDDYGWSPGEALEAATRGSARALGLSKEWGSLAPGHRAEFLALPLGPGRELWERLFGSPAAPTWA